MKRLILLMSVFLFTFSIINNIHALGFSHNQDNNIVDYYNADSGNTIITSIAGTTNQNLSLNGTMYVVDYELELLSVNEEFFLIFDNYFENATIEIFYRGDLTRNPTLYIQELTLNEEGRYYFKFTPSYEYEPAKVYLNFPDFWVGTLEYNEQKPKGFNSLIGQFVDGFQDIIYINITIWRMAFYILMFIIVVGLIAGLFGGSFWILRQAKKIKEEKAFK